MRVLRLLILELRFRVIELLLALTFWLAMFCETAVAQMHFDISLPDYRSPKKTLLTYLRAVKDNDVATAKECWWINDPEQTRILDIIAERSITEHRLNQLLRSKFPATDPEKLWTNDSVCKDAINRTIARLERSYVDVQGDCATIRIRWQELDGRASQPPVFWYRASRPIAKFRRIAGAWKLDANWEIGFQRAADFWIPQSWSYFSPEQIADNKKLISDLMTGRIGTAEEFNEASRAAYTASQARNEKAIKTRPLEPREECFFAAWLISVRYDGEFYMGRGSLWGLFHWSQRLLDAELARCHNDKERHTAADAHVERVQCANYEIKQRSESGRVAEDMYLVADIYLANAKTARAKVYGIPQNSSDVQSAAHTQLTASRLVYENCWEQVERVHRSETPPNTTRILPLDSAAYWSSWWLSSAQALATNKAEKLAAAEAFCKRAEMLQNVAKKESGHFGGGMLVKASLDRVRGEFLVRKLRWEDDSKNVDVDGAARAQLTAAQSAFETAWKILQEGRGSYLDFYDLSTDWRIAAEWLAKSQAEKIAAAEAHLARMKPLNARVSEVHREGRIPTFELWATEFYVAEAQILVAEAKRPRSAAP